MVIPRLQLNTAEHAKACFHHFITTDGSTIGTGGAREVKAINDPFMAPWRSELKSCDRHGAEHDDFLTILVEYDDRGNNL